MPSLRASLPLLSVVLTALLGPGCAADPELDDGALASAPSTPVSPSAPLSARASDARSPLFVRSAGRPIVVGPGSGEIVLADLNRDGHLDLLTKHLLARTIAVRAGNGRGEFAPPAAGPITFAYQPGAIALGDLNGDLIFDLGLARKDRDGEYVHVLLGDGGGGFGEAPGSPVTASAAIEFYKPMLLLADVNGDGNADVVTANGRRNSVEVLLGDGRGALTTAPSITLAAGRDLYTFALGDVDGDGHLDLVAASCVEAADEEGLLQVLRGDGTGAFVGARGAHGAAMRIPPGSRVAALADLDGDGHRDAVISYGRGNLGILRNDGSGIFAPERAGHMAYPLPGPAHRVVVADINGDDRSDLVAATVDSVSVLLADADDNGFTPARGSPFAAGPGAYYVAIGDVDEDGRVDLVASSFEGDAVTLLMGR